MLDIHTHILPGIDDGSRSVEESIEMLKAEQEQGVTSAVLTPHFYATRTQPESFLAARDTAYQTLLAAPDLPPVSLALGAEVQYFEGIARMERLRDFCIQGSDLLLVEMPFQPWSSRVIKDLEMLTERSDITVVLAHLERYLSFLRGSMLEAVFQMELLVQTNAEFFIDRRTRLAALRMMKSGRIDFLGSDCHSLHSRKPNMAEAVEIIRKRLGGEPITALEEAETAFRWQAGLTT